jgi:hypothetical protein
MIKPSPAASCVSVPKAAIYAAVLRKVGDAGEHVGQPGEWIDVVKLGRHDQRGHGGGAVSAALGAGDPQQEQLSGTGITTRLRGRWSGNGLREGRLRWKDLTSGVRDAAFSALSRPPSRPLPASISICYSSRACVPSGCGKRSPELLDFQLEMAISASGLVFTARARAAAAPLAGSELRYGVTDPSVMIYGTFAEYFGAG